MPSGFGCSAYSMERPHWDPSPSRSRNAAWSRGVDDQQELADARQHQRRQRVVDHRLVVNRQQLLADGHGHRVQACARAPGEDDAFPGVVFFSLANSCFTFERHIVTASHRAGQRPRFQWNWTQGDRGHSRGRYVEFEGLEWRFQESGADAAEFASALEIEFDSDNYGKASRPSESPKRPNLFFLRPAAIERRSKPNSLAADSGSDNKATATWAMLHHRFRYHIGEVCPIDLATTRHTCTRLRRPTTPNPQHIAARHEPCRTNNTRAERRSPSIRSRWTDAARQRIALCNSPDQSGQSLRDLRQAETNTRLYATTFNAPAHEDGELDAVLRIAENATSHVVSTGALTQTRVLISVAVEQEARQCSHWNC